jgi:hypothetical protein
MVLIAFLTSCFQKFQLMFLCDLGACDNRDQMGQSNNVSYVFQSLIVFSFI